LSTLPKGPGSLPTKPNNLVVSMLKRKTMASNKKTMIFIKLPLTVKMIYI